MDQKIAKQLGVVLRLASFGCVLSSVYITGYYFGQARQHKLLQIQIDKNMKPISETLFEISEQVCLGSITTSEARAKFQDLMIFIEQMTG